VPRQCLMHLFCLTLGANAPLAAVLRHAGRLQSGRQFSVETGAEPA